MHRASSIRFSSSLLLTVISVSQSNVVAQSIVQVAPFHTRNVAAASSRYPSSRTDVALCVGLFRCGDGLPLRADLARKGVTLTWTKGRKLPNRANVSH